MGTAVNLWPLIGVVVIIAGFILRLNPMLMVIVVVVTTGFAASVSTEQTLTAIRTGIIKIWALPLIILLPLAVAGLLERHGLCEYIQNWIACIQSATVDRLLIIYLAIRELTAAAGLTGLGGHPQMVYPLLTPMAEGAAENRLGKLPAPVCERLLAFCIVADNVGLFFGEDIFVAFGAITLVHTSLLGSGIDVGPLHIAMWGIPTAVYAFLIHSVRLKCLDSWLTREMGNRRGATDNTNTATAKQG